MITGNWTAKLEYLYMDLGRHNAGSFTLAPGSTHVLEAMISLYCDNSVVVNADLPSP